MSTEFADPLRGFIRRGERRRSSSMSLTELCSEHLRAESLALRDGAASAWGAGRAQRSEHGHRVVTAIDPGTSKVRTTRLIRTLGTNWRRCLRVPVGQRLRHSATGSQHFGREPAPAASEHPEGRRAGDHGRRALTMIDAGQPRGTARATESRSGEPREPVLGGELHTEANSAQFKRHHYKMLFCPRRREH